MTDARFWLVWRSDGPLPVVQHPSETTAYAEANRLALRHPGAAFFVLEAVGRVLGNISVESAALDPVGLAKRAPAAEVVYTRQTGPVVEPDRPPGTACPICGMGRQAHVGHRWCDRPAPAPASGAAYDYRPLPARMADA